MLAGVFLARQNGGGVGVTFTFHVLGDQGVPWSLQGRSKRTMGWASDMFY